ncbi:hypothetical protein [Coleofasciculus sp. E1-EBD-02]
MDISYLYSFYEVFKVLFPTNTSQSHILIQSLCDRQNISAQLVTTGNLT